MTVTWPCWVPSASGTFEGIDDEGRIVYRDTAGRERLYWHWRKWPRQGIAYLRPHEPFEGGETVVAGVVPAPERLDCPGDVWDVVTAIGANDDIDSYAAVKAAGARGQTDVQGPLEAVRDDINAEMS